MAPDVAELKLLATALKMNSAFTSLDTKAEKWVDQGLRDLKPKELEEEQKREWYELHDSWESALKNLRGKMVRFEKDSGNIYNVGQKSPILRLQQEKANYEGEYPVKLFLGFDSPQAKGYRIVELTHARWLQELFKNDPDVFYSEGMSEGAVYDLIPGRTLEPDKIQALNDTFYDDLKEAGIPAFEPIPGVYGAKSERLKAEFQSRLNKVIDAKMPYETNVYREQKLVEEIKKEHMLAVPTTSRLAVGPPISPVRVVVPVPKKEEGRRIEEWYLLFAPHLEKPWQFHYQYRSAWDVVDFKTFDEAKDFISKGSGILYLHAYRFKEPSRWDYPVDMPMFKLKVGEQWQYGIGDNRHFYHLQQPYWSGLVWIWRITDNYKYGQIYRQEEVKASENELLNGKFGYGVPPKPAPAVVAAVPPPVYELPESQKRQLQDYFISTAKMYGFDRPEKLEGEFKEVVARASSYMRGVELVNMWLEDLYQKNKLTEQEKEDAFFKAMKKEIEKRGFSSAGDIWVSVEVKNMRVAQDYSEAQKIVKNLLAKGLIVEKPGAIGLYELPTAAPIKTVSTPLYTTAHVKPEPKFSVGEKVRFRGEEFTILNRKYDESLNTWQYALRNNPYLAPYEKELAEEQTAPPLTPEEAKEEAKLEEEAEEERELEPEPDVTVYVKVYVQGGVPSDAEGKPKLENPEFVLMGTTYEEFAKYGSSWTKNRLNEKGETEEIYNEAMWSRPLVGMFSVALLNEILKEGEVEYNAIEDNALTWGNDWDQIREALADNPAPFNKYAVFHIKWRPEDLTWEESAKKAYDIYNYRYTKEELIAYRKRELQVIAKIKGLSTSGDEGELVDRIVAFVPGAEEIEQPQLVEQLEEKADIDLLAEQALKDLRGL